MGLYAERYGNHSALFGFCLLNEPAHTNMNVLQDYYKRAYASVRQHSPNAHIVLNPLITPFESGTEDHWIGFMNPKDGYQKVSMDLHYYSCFGGQGDQSDPDRAIEYIKTERKNQIHDYMNKNPKPMLIGEWSACGHFSTTRAGDFTKAQVDVYNMANLGWTFWSWTDGSPGNVWSLKTAFNSGWMDNIKESVC
jgi:Cellulase (glycosyl hydrolase family 5)